MCWILKIYKTGSPYKKLRAKKITYIVTRLITVDKMYNNMNDRKRSLYFSMHSNYHVILVIAHYFLQNAKIYVDTLFKPKNKETSATTKNLPNSRTMSRVIVVVMMTLSCKNVSRQTLTSYNRVTSLYHS